MRILNLYACLGGNRYKWDEVTDVDVTAVELDPELATLYQDRFPNDKVIVADAHDYLLHNYKEFDFIWSSPPCPSHSRVRISQKNKDTFVPIYPSMSLYEEIIFLQHHFSGKYCVENVRSYYTPLIHPQKIGRHFYWSNFTIPAKIGRDRAYKNMIERGDIKELSSFHDYDFNKYKGEQRLNKIARNLVDYSVGKSILEAALNIINKEDVNQLDIFD